MAQGVSAATARLEGRAPLTPPAAALLEARARPYSLHTAGFLAAAHELCGVSASSTSRYCRALLSLMKVGLFVGPKPKLARFG